jgi:hypothetical protein
MEERSLDEFVDQDDDESDDAGAVDDAETAETVPGAAVDPSTVDPASPTSQYEPDGVSCEECGDRARRLWIDEGRTVCGACKSW